MTPGLVSLKVASAADISPGAGLMVNGWFLTVEFVDGDELWVREHRFSWWRRWRSGLRSAWWSARKRLADWIWP